MSNKTPILVTGNLVTTPSGTQDVRLVASTITLAISAASLPLPAGAATEATLLAAKTDLDKFTFTSTRLLVDGSGVIQPISGTVSVSNFPAIQPVSQSGAWTVSLATESIEIGTVDQGNPNAGGASAWPVAVSNFPATQPVSGTVAISGSVAVTGPLTDAQLRATPVPISGTITATPTGTQDVNIVSTISLPVTGTFFQSTQPISAASLPLPTGAATEATLLAAKADLDKFTFTATRLLVDGSGVVQPISGTITANQGTSPWVTSVSNFPATVAVTQSTSPWVISGAVTNTPPANQSINLEQLNAVDLGSPSNYGTSPGSVAVIGVNAFITNTPAVTLTSTTITGNVTVTQATGTNLHAVIDNFPADADALAQGSSTSGQLGALIMGATTTAAPSYITATTNPLSLTTVGALRVDGSAVTQPISAVSLPLPTGASTAALQTQPGVDIGDVTVNNASGAAAVNIQDGGNTITVDGTVAVTQSTSPWVSNITQFGSSNIVTGTGTGGAGIPRVTVSNDSNILATQSGTWTVQPGNTPNTAPWLVEERAPGTLATYSASTLGLVAAATPTDIFTIYGSGTKTVKIVRIEISATQNTAAIRDLVLIKRSATNTGGTSASVTAVPHDSNNAGATATILSYTANPTSLGTSVGNIRTVKTDIPATNLVGTADRVIWTFGDRPGQAIVLRGTSQGLALNLNGVTSASNSFDISIEWSEE